MDFSSLFGGGSGGGTDAGGPKSSASNNISFGADTAPWLIAGIGAAVLLLALLILNRR